MSHLLRIHVRVSPFPSCPSLYLFIPVQGLVLYPLTDLESRFTYFDSIPFSVYGKVHEENFSVFSRVWVIFLR